MNPGQVTDDSELAMCLLNALNDGNGKLDLKLTCKWYAKWMNSEPFDVGGTTKNGLGGCNEQQPTPSEPITRATKNAGATSLSNGSLMKISPLAVWCQNLSVAELADAVNADVSFMHSRWEVKHMCILYTIAIQSLIKNANSADRFSKALQAVNEYVQESKVIDRSIKDFLEIA